MKCIIFDCDGVLVDSEIITTKHFIQHLHNMSYEISIEDAIKRFTGISDKMVYEKINKETGINFTSEQINHIQTQVHNSLHAEISAIPGMARLLATLDKNGNKVCVASSGTLDKINKSLSITNLIKYFPSQNIFSVQHVLKGKPAPDLFLFAAEKMEHAPQNCIVIEDSLAGIEAAIAANMQVIGFLGGSHTHYDWYEVKMRNYNIPIAHNSIELSEIIHELNEEIEIKFLIECEEHIPALAKLWHEEISQHWVSDASIEKAENRLREHLNKDKIPMAIIALHGDTPVGMACLRETDGIRPGVKPWLGSLVVDPQFRGKKIGETLIEAVKKQAKLFHYETLYLLAFDSTIPNWYTQLGWKIIGEDILLTHPVTVMSISI